MAPAADNVGPAPADAQEALRRQAEAWGISWVVRVEDEWLDAGLVARLPVDWARTHGMIPIRRDGLLCVLTANPAPGDALQGLTLALGEEPYPVLAPAEVVREAIDRCYARRSEPDPATDEGGGTAMEAEAPRFGQSADDLLRMAEDAPVSRRVNLILLDADRQGASDVHIEPQDDRLRVRYRLDGLLYDQASPPRRMEAALVSRLKVMARLDIAERRLPQDGMARVSVGEREIDIRVSTVPVPDGERVVLRLLHREAAVLPLDELGMDARTTLRMQSILQAPQGIVLVTGPTGSGKTTTLYAALNELDTLRRNVMTIEDPIEYRLPAISQIQVSPRIGLTFARCLRHVLRQDPDVILVGETRDLETAEIAVRASLTGHLVFTTLHTNSAAAAPERLMDMGIPPYLLSASLRAVLAQRLVRRLCTVCRVEAVVTREDLSDMGPEAQRMAGRAHWRAEGCPACLEGYRGRVGVFELIEMTPALSEALREGMSSLAWQRLAVEQGTRPLIADGWEKVLAGLTSIEELRRSLGATTGRSGGGPEM